MPTRTFFDENDEITKSYLQKIGKAVVIFNHLEFWIDFWIWEMINPSGSASEKQEIGRRITNPLSFSQKTDLLSSLITERLPNKVNVFKAIYDNLNKCGTKRNDIVHSQWFIQYGNIAAGISKGTTKIKYPRKLPKFAKINSQKYINTNFDEKSLDTFTSEIGVIFQSVTKFFINI